MADNTARGRFVWYELVTPNSAGAHAFYSSVLGWSTRPLDENPAYSMFAADKGPLGSSVESGDDTPYWMPYVEVPDTDAVVEQAKALGGTVLREPAALSDGSRHASLADPQGAMFGVFSSSGEPAPEADPDYGEFSWRELATPDNEAAYAFYSQLFGWERVDEVDMGPMGVYLIFGRDGRQLGGMFNKGEQGRPGPGYWLNYVRVRDLDATIKKVEAERGSLLAGPMEVPGGDWIAQFTDPYGALFAVHLAAADVRNAREQAADEKAAGKKAAKKASTKKPTTKKPTAKKATAKKPTAKKATAKKATATKPTAKKATAKKATKKKPSTKKSVTKKSVTKKAAAKKAGKAKKTTAKKAKTRKTPTKKVAKKKVAKKKVAKKKATKKKATKKKAATRKTSTAGRAKRPAKAGKRKTAKRR